jgi:hypothetical protein
MANLKNGMPIAVPVITAVVVTTTWLPFLLKGGCSSAQRLFFLQSWACALGGVALPAL